MIITKNNTRKQMIITIILIMTIILTLTITIQNHSKNMKLLSRVIITITMLQE